MPRVDTGIDLSKPVYRMADGSIYPIYIDQFRMNELNQEKRTIRIQDNMWRYHPEMRKWEKRQTYRRNRKSHLQKCKERYAQKSEQLREYGREHYRKNPEQYAMRARNRKKQIQETMPDDDVSSINLLYRFRDILNNLYNKVVFEIDHIMPLSAGGDHSFKNLRLSTKDFNSWKRSRVDVDIESYLGQGIK